MKRNLADRIMQGLNEALEHAKGQHVEGLKLHVLRSIDVAAIRAKTKLSQSAFAASVGVNVATLRNWEQRRRVPQGPARVLLSMIDRRPSIVQELLFAADH